MVCYDEPKCYTAEKYNDNFNSGVMDASIVTTSMMMQATDLGLATLWARGFNASYIESAFNFLRSHPVFLFPQACRNTS